MNEVWILIWMQFVDCDNPSFNYEVFSSSKEAVVKYENLLVNVNYGRPESIHRDRIKHLLIHSQNRYLIEPISLEIKHRIIKFETEVMK